MRNITAYDPSTPSRMHFGTGTGGVARISASPMSAPFAVRFDGSASTAEGGPVGGYDWTYEPGETGSGVVDLHVFPKAGVYEVSLTARGVTGCGSEQVWLGQTSPCAASPEATKTINYDTPPWVSAMKFSAKTIGSRTKLKFKLTEKARVTFTAQKPAKGRLVGKTCRKQTGANKTAKKCTRWISTRSLRVKGKSGWNTFGFTGKIGKTRLPRGSYRLRAVAVDTAGGKSPARTAAFRVR